MKTVNEVIYEEGETYGGVCIHEVRVGDTMFHLKIAGSPIRLFIKPEEYDRMEVYDRKGHEHCIFYPDTKEHRQHLIDLLIVAFGLEDEEDV